MINRRSIQNVFSLSFPFFLNFFFAFFLFSCVIFSFFRKKTEKKRKFPTLRYERIIYARYCIIMRQKFLRSPPWWKLFFVWRKVSIPSKETHSSCLSLCKERHKETRVCRLEPQKQWYYTRSKFHLLDTVIRILFPKFLPCHMHSFLKFLLTYISFRIIFLKFYP